MHQIESYLNKINIQRSLNVEEQNSCGRMANVGIFLKSLTHSKSPGIDGLPGEFYKLFSRSSAKSAKAKTCYVQGRSVCQNIRLGQDVIA